MSTTSNYNPSRKEGDIVSQPVAASTTIYQGTLVAVNADGYIVGASDTAGIKFAGVAAEYVANASTTNGAKNVIVFKDGSYEFVTSGIAQTNLGDTVYAVDNNTVNLAAVTTNDIAVGTIVEVISATKVRVKIDLSVK